MAVFLFQLELPAFNDEIANAIPPHRAFINQLFAEGKLVSYSVSVNRAYIWCIINANDEQEAMEMVLEFPLYRHFTEVSCHPLLFHNTMSAALPGISLN
jgi:hypothetical protein